MHIDYAMPVKEIGRLLDGLVRQPAPPPPVGADAYRATLKEEVDIAAGNSPLEMKQISPKEPSIYSCPGCNGVLMRVEEGTQDRFRCYTGHGYSAAALFDEYLDSVEEKLWQSAKTMQETLFLLTEAVRRATAAGEVANARALAATVCELEERVETVRALALKQPKMSLTGDAAASKVQDDGE